MGAKSADSGVITIKKYANRRLYNTKTSSYVTLDHLAEMIKQNEDFVVVDAKTGEDLTRAVLTQIIVEQEGKGQNLLPVKFLRQIIGFYGDSLGGVLPRYLEESMDVFTQNEGGMRDAMQHAFKGFFPVEQFEDMAKQNMAMFENAMKMMTPFASQAPGQSAAQPEPPPEPTAPSSPPGNVDDLKAQLDAMQSQLEGLIKARNS
ncbi:MAG: polyhydroxyalkanoate synthesis repressor PhaR [Rhodospirillaceae bacterium]|jgi:polyhydroxyalkanoate synthesis repressor PhaR|nr:polyhydroxyalkanoate synthesis repressor PhaR [Rhodospirillaceae bacterium]MBT5239976.1 polyhydroxyalkanoate synthesis repressor PhaR [Rhodospirillaceae bacterium]MBT5564362.1 polyhydroxyalkanoate synthesis repressor PhaR [Rhodospirillaceae bacterium]MBT6090075.1 polyhydroxyalkanoate synthesis repressor PhaR [Rhodospirillaceae bacterium]MBT6959892.1 polyhydroxyalkanoate synthesis repressor PhaR [Rhodospirillaceae bacterium]